MDRETAIKTLGRWAIAAERRADQHEHDYEVDTRVSADGEIAAANRERTYAKTCLVIAEMLRHAAPVGEPAAMPPVEVGDWVSDIEAPDVPYAVRKDEQAKRCSSDLSRFVSEIRKANGVIWRRTDRKEPTS